MNESPTPPPERRPLSRAWIIEEAIALADGEGLVGLSMRKLAGRLGVEAMSLYNHVKNKEHLLDAMVDRVIEELEIPSTEGPWKAVLRGRAHAAHEMLLRHRWAPQLIVSRVNVGPAMLRYVDATLGCLRTAGFTFEQADQAWNAIDSHVYGFTLQEMNFPFDPSEYRDAAQAFLPLIPAETHPHLHALTREVAAGHHAGIQDFSFGLEMLLDGLERLLQAEP